MYTNFFRFCVLLSVVERISILGKIIDGDCQLPWWWKQLIHFVTPPRLPVAQSERVHLVKELQVWCPVGYSHSYIFSAWMPDPRIKLVSHTINWCSPVPKLNIIFLTHAKETVLQSLFFGKKNNSITSIISLWWLRKDIVFFFISGAWLTNSVMDIQTAFVLTMESRRNRNITFYSKHVL
jgi:hypothetical protein